MAFAAFFLSAEEPAAEKEERQEQQDHPTKQNVDEQGGPRRLASFPHAYLQGAPRDLLETFGADPEPVGQPLELDGHPLSLQGLFLIPLIEIFVVGAVAVGGDEPWRRELQVVVGQPILPRLVGAMLSGELFTIAAGVYTTTHKEDIVRRGAGQGGRAHTLPCDGELLLPDEVVTPEFGDGRWLGVIAQTAAPSQGSGCGEQDSHSGQDEATALTLVF